MKVAYVCFGRGSGGLVRGVSLFFALQRASIDCDFTALSDCEFYHIVKPFFRHISIVPQPDHLFSRDRQTELYRALEDLVPDVVIVDGIWVPIYPISRDFTWKKVLLIRHIPAKWFTLPLPDGSEIHINPQDYDLALNIEPNFSVTGFLNVNPVVIRNPDELLPRSRARDKLGVPVGMKLCVVAHNGYEEEIDRLIDESGRVPSDFYTVVTTNREKKGLFPLADYSRGIDLLISGAGYNTFYESQFLDIQVHFTVFERESGESQAWRVKTNGGYRFTENGADQIVQMIKSL